MRKALSFVAAALMLMSLAACGGGSSSSQAPSGSGESAPVENRTPSEGGEIVIGVITPQTGAVAIYGQAVENGVKMAFEEINAAGGVAGKTFRLEILDDKGDPVESNNAYNMLMDKEMDFLLGPVTSKPTLAVAESAARDGIPLLTASATQADVTTYGDNIFRTCFTDPFQGSVLANFAANNLQLKKCAVLYNTSDDYSSGIAQSFQTKAGELGLEVVSFEGYGATDKDFKTQLTSIQSAGAEVLILPDYYQTAALVIAQAREIGLDIPVLGPDGFDGVLDVVNEADVAILNNVYFTGHYFIGDTDPKVADFVAAFTEKHGAAPNAFAALGYDSAYIIAEAYKATEGNTDFEAVVEAMKNTDYAGVAGNVKYGDNGDPIKSVSIIEIVDGAYQLTAKVEG